MALSTQEFTNAGRAMLGRAQAGEVLTVSKIVVGSGAASGPGDLWPLTALIIHEMDVTISAKNDYGQGTLLVEGSFLSSDAPHVFQLRELGIMAHIGAEADQLYSVANAFSDPVDTIDPASPSVHAYKVKLIIDRIPTSSLVVQIGPSENVIGQNIGSDSVGPGWYKDAAGNILDFKRAVEGDGIALTDNGDSITIAQRKLTANLDLYVPLTYPGAPPDSCFDTIQHAHDYLLQYFIPSDKLATIHVAAGTYHASGINLNHPQAQQIILSGWTQQVVTATQINYLDSTSFGPTGGLLGGGRGHKNVSCDVSSLGVGMIVYLTDCDSPWAGASIITAVNSISGYATLNVLDRGSQSIYSVNDHGSGRHLKWFPTVLICDNPAAQNLNCPNGINQLVNLTVQGGNSGINLGDSGTVSNVLAISCGSGINATNGQLSLGGEVIVADCSFGLTGSAVMTCAAVLIANACTNGINPGAGAQIGAYTSGLVNAKLYMNHCNVGALVFSATLHTGSVLYSCNDNGMKCQHVGSIWSGPAFGAFPLNNGTDLFAQGMAYIEYNKVGGTTPVCSPTAGTVGNDNSLIKVI